jgi:hypothetical protein
MVSMVSSRAGLDVMEKRKKLVSAGNRTAEVIVNI